MKTKALYPLLGQVQITFEVRSNIITVEIGTKTTNNVKRDFNFILENAKLNAIYKHIQKGGSSGSVVEYIDHTIEYLDFEGITVKRIKRRQRYFTMVRKDGKIFRLARWTSRRTLQNDF